MSSLRVQPLSLRPANDFIALHHRHHKPARGCKFCISVVDEDAALVGVCIVGRPVARNCDDGITAEVTRLCTLGNPNACSMLYGAAARAAKAIGYSKIQTYILSEEPGTSLKATGWIMEGETKAGSWCRGDRSDRRTDQPEGAKQRWARYL